MTIPIALAITGAATAGTTAYQIKSANSTNKRAQQLQGASDQRASAQEAAQLAAEQQIESARLADTKQARAEALQRDRERWADYVHANEPFWNAGAGILSNLSDMAGIHGGSTPSMPNASAPPPAAPASSGALASLSAMMNPDVVRPQPMRRIAPNAPMPTSPQTGMSLQDLMMMAQQSAPAFGSSRVPAGT